MVRISNHSNWTTFSRNLSQGNDSRRVITSINIQLHSLCFSLRKDIFNHRDISCVSFFNHGSVYFLINIYTDLSQMALNVKIVDGRLCFYFLFFLNFIFHFLFFYFSIFRTTQVRVYQSRCHISHKLMA